MTGLSKIALIVGGEEGLRLQLARWLSVFGIDSVQVEQAGAALVLAETLAPDLIVLAADEDGGDLARYAARTARLRRGGTTCVMLCANGGNVELMSAAVAGGADECLVAPFDADILRFKLEQTGVL